ncbi:MAG: GTP pyrophosphokinase [Clostridia bacterium]|nr:GTP pyrophosphokinase [Clostridia bacterium]
MLKKYLSEDKYEEIKNSDNLIYKALELVTILFENDVDKGGFPYILHLMYVYKHVSTIEEKTIALLHDVIEDKKVDAKDLIDIGFPEDIVNDVSMLTRVKPMEYNDYIDRIIKNGSIRALHVKLADLENNMDLNRIKNPTVKDFDRVQKRYIPTHEKIMNRLKEIE